MPVKDYATYPVRLEAPSTSPMGNPALAVMEVKKISPSSGSHGPAAPTAAPAGQLASPQTHCGPQACTPTARRLGLRVGGSALRSPVVKRPAGAPVTQQGWLHKQGSEGLMLWKKRWFVLCDYCLFYYKGPEEEKLLGSILLPSYTISPCTYEVDRVYRKFSFKAEHVNMRTYYFAADTHELMVQWMHSMSLASMLQDRTREEIYRIDYDIIHCYEEPRLITQQPGKNHGSPGDESDAGFSTYRSRMAVGSGGAMNGWHPQQQQQQHLEERGFHHHLYANAPPKPRRLANEDMGSSSDQSPEHPSMAQPQQPARLCYQYNPAAVPQVQSRLMMSPGNNAERRTPDTYSRPAGPLQVAPIGKLPKPSDYEDIYNSERRLLENQPWTNSFNHGPGQLAYLQSSGASATIITKNYEATYSSNNNKNNNNSNSVNNNNNNNISRREKGTPQLPTSQSAIPVRYGRGARSNHPPRPHSADFLEYDARRHDDDNGIDNKSPELQNSGFRMQGHTQPPRPKSSLDIMRDSDNLYWSEESYAQKMRQSAYLLQQTPGGVLTSPQGTNRSTLPSRSPMVSPMMQSQTSSRISELATNRVLSPSAELMRESEQQHLLQMQRRQQQLLQEQKLLQQQLEYQKQQSQQEQMERRQIEEEEQRQLMSYYSEQQQQPPFLRSASARLPRNRYDGERDEDDEGPKPRRNSGSGSGMFSQRRLGAEAGNRKFQQYSGVSTTPDIPSSVEVNTPREREKSMKRLLEWKQRMLQSPLQRKSSGSTTRGVNSAQNQLSKYYKQQALRELADQERRARELAEQAGGAEDAILDEQFSSDSKLKEMNDLIDDGESAIPWSNELLDMQPANQEASRFLPAKPQEEYGKPSRSRSQDGRRSSASNRYTSYSSDDEIGDLREARKRSRRPSQSNRSRRGSTEERTNRKMVSFDSQTALENRGIIKQEESKPTSDYSHFDQHQDLAFERNEGMKTAERNSRPISKGRDGYRGLHEDRLSSGKYSDSGYDTLQNGGVMDLSNDSTRVRPLKPNYQNDGRQCAPFPNSSIPIRESPGQHLHDLKLESKVDETTVVKEYSFHYVKHRDYGPNNASSSSQDTQHSRTMVQSRKKMFEDQAVSSARSPTASDSFSDFPEQQNRSRSVLRSFALGEESRGEREPAAEPPQQDEQKFPKSVKDLLADFERKSQRAKEQAVEQEDGKRCVFSDTETLMYDTSSDPESNKVAQEEDEDGEVAAALGKREQFVSTCRDLGKKKHTPSESSTPTLNKQLDDRGGTPGASGFGSAPSANKLASPEARQEDDVQSEMTEEHYMPMTPSKKALSDTLFSHNVPTSANHPMMMDAMFGTEFEESSYVEMTTGGIARSLLAPNDGSSFAGDRNGPRGTEAGLSQLAGQSHYELMFRAGSLHEPLYMEVSSTPDLPASGGGGSGGGEDSGDLQPVHCRQYSNCSAHRATSTPDNHSQMDDSSDHVPPTPPRLSLPDILNSSNSSFQQQKSSIKSESSDADDEASKDLDSLDTPRHPRFSLSDTFRPASYYLGASSGIASDRNLMGIPVAAEHHDSSDSDLVSPPPIPTSPPPLDDLETSLELHDSSLDLKKLSPIHSKSNSISSQKDSTTGEDWGQSRLHSKRSGSLSSQADVLLQSPSNSSNNSAFLDDAQNESVDMRYPNDNSGVDRVMKRRPVSDRLIDRFDDPAYITGSYSANHLDSIGRRSGVAIDFGEADMVDLDRYLQNLHGSNVYPNSKEDVNAFYNSYQKGARPSSFGSAAAESQSNAQDTTEVLYENLQSIFPPLPPPEVLNHLTQNEQSNSPRNVSSTSGITIDIAQSVPPPPDSPGYTTLKPPSIQSSGYNTLPSQPSQSSGYNTLPSQPSQSSGYNTLPPQSSQSSGYNTLPPQSSQSSGYNTLPPQSSQSSGYNTLPAQPSQPSGYAPVPPQSSAFNAGPASGNSAVQTTGQSPQQTGAAHAPSQPGPQSPQGAEHSNPPQAATTSSPQSQSEMTGAPYYYSDLLRGCSDDGFASSSSDRDRERSLTAARSQSSGRSRLQPLNNQRNQRGERTEPLDVKRNDVGRKVNPIPAPASHRGGDRLADRLAEDVRSTSVSFLGAEKCGRVDQRNLYDADTLQRSARDRPRPRSHTPDFLEHNLYPQGIRDKRRRSRSVEGLLDEPDLQDHPESISRRAANVNQLARPGSGAGPSAGSNSIATGGGDMWEEDSLWRESLRRVSLRHTRSLDNLDDPPAQSPVPASNTVRLPRGATYVNENITRQRGDASARAEPIGSPASPPPVRDYEDYREARRYAVRSMPPSGAAVHDPDDRDDGVHYERLSRFSSESLERTRRGQTYIDGYVWDADRETFRKEQQHHHHQQQQQQHQHQQQQMMAMAGNKSFLEVGPLPVTQAGGGLPGAGSLGRHPPQGGLEGGGMLSHAGEPEQRRRLDHKHQQQATSTASASGSVGDLVEAGDRDATLALSSLSARISTLDREISALSRSSTTDLLSPELGRGPEGFASPDSSTSPPSPGDFLEGLAMRPRVWESLEVQEARAKEALEFREAYQAHKVNVSAGELLGRTHEELVLLLIQLRRASAAVCKAMETCHMEIETQARLAELETPKQMEHMQKLEDLKKQLVELEKQYEKGKPLVNLVDNMVKLGSLYRGGTPTSGMSGSSSLQTLSGLPVRERMEFNFKVQEQRLLAEERRDWDRLSPDYGQLQAKVQQLYRLDREMQEESHTLQTLQVDKELVERALSGLRYKLSASHVPPNLKETYRKQQRLLERELSRVRLLLAHNSKKLEETVAENARLEQELVILRQKLQSSRHEASSPTIGFMAPEFPPSPEAPSTPTAQLEAELKRVQLLMGDLHRQRQELSVAVRQLTEKSEHVRPGPTGIAGAGPIPGKKRQQSSWIETDLDSLVTSDVGGESKLTSPVASVTPATTPLTSVPLYVNTEMDKRQDMSSGSADSGMETPALITSDEPSTQNYNHIELSEADDRMKRYYGIIPKEKQQEIKTVRIVKRESERRQRDRDRSGNIGIPVLSASTKRAPLPEDPNDNSTSSAERPQPTLGQVLETEEVPSLNGVPPLSSSAFSASFSSSTVNTTSDSALSMGSTALTPTTASTTQSTEALSSMWSQESASSRALDEAMAQLDGELEGDLGSSFHRSRSLPRGFGKTNADGLEVEAVPSNERYSRQPRRPMRTPSPGSDSNLHTAAMRRQRVRFDTHSGSGSESNTSSPSGPRPLTAREQLFGNAADVHLSTGYSMLGLSSRDTSPQLSPVFTNHAAYQSEAARQIVMEMNACSPSVLLQQRMQRSQQTGQPLPTSQPQQQQQLQQQSLAHQPAQHDSSQEVVRRLVPREKRRHYTVSGRPLSEVSNSSIPSLGTRSRDDLDMERALRTKHNAAPDVVRSTLSRRAPKYDADTIDSLLGTPGKIHIPERYVPESEPALSQEERLQRSRKAEAIRKMLSETRSSSTLLSAACEEEPPTSTLKKKAEEEKKQHEHLLQLNQILAKQVMEKSKLVAEKALAELPPQENDKSTSDDESPEQPLPIYQQRENYFS